MASSTPQYAQGENINPDVTPIISTGTSAPSSTPGKAGDIFVDTTNGNVYVATGNSSSGDWQQLSNAA